MAKKKAKDEEKAAKAAPQVGTTDVVEAAINKNFGPGTIIKLGIGGPLQRFDFQIPTGSLGLDIALGPMVKKNGIWQHGLPGGRGVEIKGPEGAGKTTLCLSIMANAQAKGCQVAFIDMEHAMDPPRATQLGVQLDKLAFSQPSNGEQALNILEAMVRSRCYQVIVVDSIASLVPQAELDGAIGDQHMGLQARLMSQATRMLRNCFGEGSQCLVIFTNQIREKVGVMFGNPETTPGGRAMRHFADFRIDVRRGKDIPDRNGVVIGQDVTAKVIKNKVAQPYRIAEFQLIFGAGYKQGVNFERELVQLCIGTGVILVNGSWCTLPNGQQIQGAENVELAIHQTRDAQGRGGLGWLLYDGLLTRVMAAQGYTPEGERVPGWNPGLVDRPMMSFLQPGPAEPQEPEGAQEAAGA